MASAQQVQSFLAYWFQLGKPVVLQHREVQMLPTPVFEDGVLSSAFQDCWQQIMERPEKCFLRGTDESIAELLSEEWDIEACARCTMPLPLPVRGVKSSACPCIDLPSWPNEEVPPPRSAICTNTRLDNIRQRLEGEPADDRDRLQATFTQSPNLYRESRLPVDSELKMPSEQPALDD